MNPGNVVSLTMPNGNVYAYACQNGYIQKYAITFTTVGTGQGVNSKISFTTHKPSTASVAAAAFQMMPDGTAMRHVFYQEPKTNLIWYFAESGGDSQSYTALPTQITVPSENNLPLAFAGGFSVVSHANGVILVGVPYITNSEELEPSVAILQIPWAALSPATWMQGVGSSIPEIVSFQAGADFDPKDCDVAAMLCTDPSTGNQYLGWISRQKDSHGVNYVGRSYVQMSSDWTTVASTTAQGAPMGQALCFQQDKVQYLKLLKRPDNMIELYFFDKTWSVCQANMSVADFLAAAPVTPAAQSDFSIVNVMSKGKGQKVQYGSNAFEIIFVNGPLSQQTSTANSELQDATIPLYPGIVYWSNGNLQHQVSQQLWIQLARRGLPAVPGQRIMLGIIEGPPPIPNENLNMNATWDPYTFMGQPGFADTYFATMQTATSGINLSWKAGILISAQTKVEIDENFWIFQADAYVKAQLELETTYRGTYTDIETLTLSSGTTTRAEIPQNSDTQQYYVKAAGSLLLMDAQWTGYAYAILDASGNQVPGAITYRSIFPTHTSITATPYLIPPSSSGFPAPGNLMSYMLEPDEAAALAADSVIQFQGGIQYLTNAWGYNTKTVSNYTTTDQVSWSHGLTVDLKVLLGVGGKGALLGTSAETEVSGAVKIGFESIWNWVSATGQNIGVDLQLRGNSQAPNSYTYYVFYVYQLADDNQWASDLLSNLISPTFPTDPNERAQQQALVDQIYPGSTPWKICYSVDPQQFHFNQPVSNVLARASTPTADLAQACADAGIETSQNLEELLNAAERVADGEPLDELAGTVSCAASGDAGARQALLQRLAASRDTRAMVRQALAAAQRDIGAHMDTRYATDRARAV